MASFKLNQAHGNCADCPIHDKLSLKRLGVDAENSDYVVALAGNPNTGKSTIFNALTGLKQHTGNWTGKTVARTEGSFVFHDKKYKILDLPGTYSLISSSLEEEIARNFILFGKPDVTVIVVDATRLERNLNLAIQILEISGRVVICLNLIDEAEKKGIGIDTKILSRELGVPVVATDAREQRGIYDLLSTIEKVARSHDIPRARQLYRIPSGIEKQIEALEKKIWAVFPEISNAAWLASRILDDDLQLITALKNGEIGISSSGEDSKLTSDTKSKIEDILETARHLKNHLPPNYHDKLVEHAFSESAQITAKASSRIGNSRRFNLDLTLDRIFLSPVFGYPIMFVLFAFMFWLTISGANIPSAFLFELLVDKGHFWLKSGGEILHFPWWLSGVLFDGMYLATAWVVSVMLPPMAIFFPLFTLLEDFGYLPRVAFNMDNLFKKAGAHGKQVMTMMMGFGCNAAGVVATRIIDSPRERLIAIITNNFAICNGRWPTQILLATIFIGALVPAHIAGFVSAMAVVGIALFGVFLTFIVSWGLSKTVLKGEPSIFSLELPPYRAPKFWQTIYTSIVDRTLFVLWRAVVFAMPAGVVIWLIANVNIAGSPIALYMINGLDPVAWFMGLNGIILVAYIVAIPANEIVVPTILMLIVLVGGNSIQGDSAGVMFEMDSMPSLESLLRSSGWTLLTAVNLMLFSLIHNPCSTTIFTIFKETKNLKWTFLATFLPVVLGTLITITIALLWRI